jgi:hypothetical protein
MSEDDREDKQFLIECYLFRRNDDKMPFKRKIMSKEKISLKVVNETFSFIMVYFWVREGDDFIV